MGNYADWEDVTSRYPKVNDVADADELQASYVEGVEAWMDSYLAKQFTTPVSGTPPLLKDICIDLVYCKVAFNREKGIPKLKEDTLMILKDICSNAILMSDSDGTVITSNGQAVWSTTEDYDATFSMLGPLNDLIDPDLLEDLINDRS